MSLPYPQQISSNPDVNASAMAWAAQLVDALTTHMLQLASAQAGRKIAFGTATITWPGASVTSNTLTVTHGLGATAVNLSVTCSGQSGVNFAPSLVAFSPTATQFSVAAYTIDGQLPLNTATETIYWLAIA